jgi:hypothetical protein
MGRRQPTAGARSVRFEHRGYAMNIQAALEAPQFTKRTADALRPQPGSIQRMGVRFSMRAKSRALEVTTTAPDLAAVTAMRTSFTI